MARPRTPLLSIDRIVDEAISMAGTTGAFTMTELATKLGVRQSSLYNHVDGRDEVLELVRQRLHEDMGVKVDISGRWQDVVRAMARAQRAALARHPWLVPLLATSPAEPGGAASSVENVATLLSKAGFADADVLQIIAMVDIIIIGGSLDLVSPEHLYPDEVLEGSDDLARVVRAAPTGVSRADAGFEFTLDLVITALEQRLEHSSKRGHSGTPHTPEANA
ncbi:TetR/AcrR family transcriptional regulator [Plantibacter sp. Mn2098]|uniref:TetR/AcrR family transcriptional regulator n=1 Tax=Plantibacter sp. Mn2098 TaxID=3395266 RepID=UPI003BE802B4